MNSKIINYLTCLFCFLLLSREISLAQTSASSEMLEEKGRVFIINAPHSDLNGFRELVSQVVALKPYGKVQVNISTLADKSFHEIPAKGSSWHEYASSNPTPSKFFPDPKLAPFLPAEFVKKNRQLLLAKAKILRENGLEAAFIGYEPNFLPAAFFDAYPAMLGPRVDHPRRSTEKAFAPCISAPETQEMYINMIAEMLKSAPEISSFSFKTNDAGAGICWSEWLYTGPNGPSHCKHQSIGQRVKLFMETLQAGAAKAKRPLSIYMDAGASNFTDAEQADIEAQLPANCYFLGKEGRAIQNIGGTLGSLYPVTGIANPVSLLRSVRSLNRNTNKTFFIVFRAAYDRGIERADMTGLILDLVTSALKSSGSHENEDPIDALKQLSREWGGEKSADDLFNAFTSLNEAFSYKSATFPQVHSLYWGITERFINRPLVIAPQRLTEKEEAYFLPYIFNVSAEEARMDYMDIHGARRTIAPNVVENYVGRILRVSRTLEGVDASAPKREFLQRMATALKIHASIIRSCGNFAAAQAIRDKNKEILNAPPQLPSKDVTWAGHPDFIKFNNIMRDELDNTLELINTLEGGGLPLVIRANSQLYEDAFILGPDLVSQLKLKRKIMLDHWQDIEGYLASPFK